MKKEQKYNNNNKQTNKNKKIALWQAEVVKSQCQKDVKLSKRYQIVKKCQMLKNQTTGLWRRFTKNKINWHNTLQEHH